MWFASACFFSSLAYVALKLNAVYVCFLSLLWKPLIARMILNAVYMCFNYWVQYMCASSVCFGGDKTLPPGVETFNCDTAAGAKL